MNIHGNEAADKMAKSAAFELLPRLCPLSCRDFFPSIRLSINESWQQHWNFTRQNLVQEVTNLIYHWNYFSMPRHWEVVLCGLCKGHTRLTYGFVIVRRYPLFHDDCLVPLTVRHLLGE